MNLLCLACGEASTVEPEDDVRGCPKCGDTGMPADLDDAVNLHITKHELRILTMWASNYAGLIEEKHSGSVRAVQTICDRLGTQVSVPLTMAQEIADVRAAFTESAVKVYRSDGSEVDI
jgi:hypothetical protein